MYVSKLKWCFQTTMFPMYVSNIHGALNIVLTIATQSIAGFQNISKRSLRWPEHEIFGTLTVERPSFITYTLDTVGYKARSFDRKCTENIIFWSPQAKFWYILKTSYRLCCYGYTIFRAPCIIYNLKTYIGNIVVWKHHLSLET